MAKSDIWKASAERRALQATNAALKQQHAQVQVELDLERWDQADVSQLQQQLASLQGELDHAWTCHQEAGARVAHLQTCLVMAKNDIWKASAERHALQATNAALKQKHARVQVELDLERWDQADVSQLQQQLANLKGAEARIAQLEEGLIYAVHLTPEHVSEPSDMSEVADVCDVAASTSSSSSASPASVADRNASPKPLVEVSGPGKMH